MKRVLKWIGIGLGVLVALLVVAMVVLNFMGSARLNQSFEIQVEDIDIPMDSAAVQRGKHLAEALTICQECHGENLEGSVMDDEPLITTLAAPNLTSGQGSVTRNYSDADWVRSIRHGVDPEGHGLVIMHSDAYHNLSNEDLGAVIAYAKSVPPADNEVVETKAAFLGNVLIALGLYDMEDLPLIPAEKIDHNAPFHQTPAEEVSAEYGRYLVSITVCSMCHGSDFKGGSPLEPGAPSAPDITPDGELMGVTADEFVEHFREHAEEEDQYMPWEVFNRLTDEELEAIWLYLSSLGNP